MSSSSSSLTKMTSSEITSTAIIVHKRKRLQVSYVNDDDNGLDDQPETGEAGNEDNSHQDLDAYEHDLSATFGSTKVNKISPHPS